MSNITYNINDNNINDNINDNNINDNNINDNNINDNINDNNIITQTFGYLGASTLIITLLPQLYLTYKTKKVDNLSLGFLCLQELTCILFLIYGILLKEIPLIIANSLVGLQGIILLNMKMTYK
jgi:MtN3 and saliva related transmembrane protein